MYKYQSQVTKKFGVEFRSKLEAQWAIHFEDQGFSWEYVDKQTHDFEVEGYRVEIKPLGFSFLRQAVSRLFEDKVYYVCLGSPESGCCDMATTFRVTRPEFYSEEYELLQFKLPCFPSFDRSKICSVVTLMPRQRDFRPLGFTYLDFTHMLSDEKAGFDGLYNFRDEYPDSLGCALMSDDWMDWFWVERGRETKDNETLHRLYLLNTGKLN